MADLSGRARWRDLSCLQVLLTERREAEVSYSEADIAKKADRIVRRCETRDPHAAAEALGIMILYRDFRQQRGVYKVILRNRFIFLKSDLSPIQEKIVLWHEIGHDVLHRHEAAAAGGFQEFNLFDMQGSRLEYEANLFAAQASLPDGQILEYIDRGLSLAQIAQAMYSDVNLVALKADILIAQGHPLRRQEHQSDFLGYRR